MSMSMNMKNHERAKRQLSAMAVFISVMLASASLPVMAAPAKQNTTPVTGHKPVVAPVLNSTAPYVGETVTVDPKFSDIDGDVEDTSATGTSYQWQVEDTMGSGTFSNISGATGKTYVPVDADKGKKLVVKVIPRTDPAITDPAVGDEVLSDIALIQVGQPVPDAANSALSVSTIQANNTITAGEQSDTDSLTKATLTLTINDSVQHPIKGQAVAFSVTPTDAGITMSNVVDNQDGTYSATLTATKAQTYSVTTLVNGSTFGNAQPNLQGTVRTVGAAPDAAHTVVEPYNNLAQAAVASDIANVGFQAHLFDRFNNVATWKSTDLNITVPGFDVGHVTTTMDASTNTITVSAGAKSADDITEYIGQQVDISPNTGSGGNLLTTAELSKLTIVPKVSEVDLEGNIYPLKDNQMKNFVIPRLFYTTRNLIPVNPATGADFSAGQLNTVNPWSMSNTTGTVNIDISYSGAPAGFLQHVSVNQQTALKAIPVQSMTYGDLGSFYQTQGACSIGSVADLSAGAGTCPRSGVIWTQLINIFADEARHSSLLGGEASYLYASNVRDDPHGSLYLGRYVQYYDYSGAYLTYWVPDNKLVPDVTGKGWAFWFDGNYQPYQ